VALASTVDVIGRDEELRRLFEFLDAARELPVTMIVEGEAGSGKSTLFAACVDAAGERRYRILMARPAEPERDLSFVALRDVLGDVFDEVAGDLPAPQRRALSVALLREEPSELPPDRAAIASAFLRAVRALARATPVLIAIDDAHWLDLASLLALEFVVARLRQEHVGMLLTCRTDERIETLAAIERGAGEERFEEIVLGPLSLGALHVLLRSRLGLVLPRPILRRVHESSGGNPFFALEIGRDLRARGEPADPGRPLPVPATLRSLLEGRLSRLSDEARLILPSVAALSRPTDGELASLMGRPVRTVVEEAIRADVLSREGDRLRFAHPLLAAHVYADLTPSDRRALHRRVVHLASDPEERARHLALGAEGSSKSVADAIDEAARIALARGAPSRAAELFDQASRLTPSDEKQAGWGRLVEAAWCSFVGGDTGRAESILSGLLEQLPAGALRAKVLTALGRTSLFTDDLRRAAAVFAGAIAEKDAEPAVRGEAEEGLAWSLVLARSGPAAAASHAREAAALAEEVGDEDALAEALAIRGMSEFLLGEPGGIALVERVASTAVGRTYRRVMGHPDWTLGVVLTWADDLERARTTLDLLRVRAIDRGDESSLPRILFALSHVHLLAGDWAAAERDATEGHEIAMQEGQEPQVGLLLFSKAIVDAHLGAIAATRAAAEPGLESPGRSEAGVLGMVDRLALAALELPLRHPGDVHQLLWPLVERMVGAGIVEPGAMRFVTDEIEALVQLGRLDEAEDLLAEHEDRASRTDRASARAACARCRGLVVAARGDAAGALDSFGVALEQHKRAPMPFERARTLLALGATNRRAKQKRAARASLSEASATFARLGASLWVDLAEGELARIGGRAPAGGLTPSERRVAELVAEGRSNKEVAAALFVTVKTVEATLSRVYPKLGVRSRTALARRLAEERLEPHGKL
jgi:DNA-binding CsgD family transcriptional regulator